jgi:hypothetical protein
VHHRFSRSHGLARCNEPALEPKNLVGERDDAAVRMGAWCRIRMPYAASVWHPALFSTKAINAEAIDRLTPAMQ